MTELFHIEPVLSPRLRWMEQHNITLRHHEDSSAHHLNWSATDDAFKCFGWGETEEEALCQLARKLGLKHWSEA